MSWCIDGGIAAVVTFEQSYNINFGLSSPPLKKFFGLHISLFFCCCSVPSMQTIEQKTGEEQEERVILLTDVSTTQTSVRIVPSSGPE